MQSTTSIDCDSKVIQEKSRILTQGQKDIIERARSLFYFTRDEIRYNPYASLYPIEASGTLDRGYGFCVQKAALLAALARAAGIWPGWDSSTSAITDSTPTGKRYSEPM